VYTGEYYTDQNKKGYLYEEHVYFVDNAKTYAVFLQSCTVGQQKCYEATCICQYFTAFPKDILFACLIEKSYGVNLLSLALLLYQVLEGV
jgi:hypothetical protein